MLNTLLFILLISPLPIIGLTGNGAPELVKVTGYCAEDCEGKVCGDDGCGGSCGSCAGHQGGHSKALKKELKKAQKRARKSIC